MFLQNPMGCFVGFQDPFSRKMGDSEKKNKQESPTNFTNYLEDHPRTGPGYVVSSMQITRPPKCHACILEPDKLSTFLID